MQKFPGTEPPARFAVVSRRVVTAQGLVDGAVVVAHGRIEAVVPRAQLEATLPVYDAAELAVMPGIVDTHVHVNEPGRTDWEGYETATRAAAAGGITTMVDMPLNCIPVTTSVAALDTKLAALRGKLTVDCGFYGGFVPGNEGELEPLARRGVLGFKAFMVHSGIDDFPNVTAADLDRGLPVIAKTGVPLLAHAELELPGAPSAAPDALPEPYARYLESRPKEWENAAIRMLVDKSRTCDCRVHVVHLSSAEALPILRDARRSGVRISAETCPHYLTFTAEEIKDGDTRFKCSPPIREAANQERLWQGLSARDIDFVVSDHSPCTPQLKLLERGDFDKAWGGIAGLQFGLASVWTGARRRGADLVQLAAWMSAGPAALVGLTGRKGALAAGYDADIVVFDPDKKARVDAASVHHRHKVTPYEARELTGVVEATFARGRLVYERGRFLREGAGEALLRRAADA
jgi:allantoinase